MENKVVLLEELEFIYCNKIGVLIEVFVLMGFNFFDYVEDRCIEM